MKRLLAIAAFTALCVTNAWSQCGNNGVFNGTGRAGDILCTGKVGAAGYNASFTTATTLTVTAATHGQGVKPFGVCYDNSTPANTIALTAGYPQVAANGDISFAWTGSKTGYCLISGLGNTTGPAGATGATGAAGSNGAAGATGPAGPTGPAGATGPAGPAPSGTGLVQSNSGTAALATGTNVASGLNLIGGFTYCTGLVGDGGTGNTDNGPILAACLASYKKVTYAPPATYYCINSTVTISGVGVELEGFGGRPYGFVTANGQSAFRWCGADNAAGPMILMQDCTGCSIRKTQFLSAASGSSSTTAGVKEVIRITQSASPTQIETNPVLDEVGVYGAGDNSSFIGVNISPAPNGNNVENGLIRNSMIQCSQKSSGGGVGTGIANTNSSNALGWKYDQVSLWYCGTGATLTAGAATATWLAGLTQGNTLAFAIGGSGPFTVKGVQSEADIQFATATGPGKVFEANWIRAYNPPASHYAIDILNSSKVSFKKNIFGSPGGTQGPIGCPVDGGFTSEGDQFDGTTTASLLTGMANCSLHDIITDPTNFQSQGALLIQQTANGCATVTPTTGWIILCGDPTNGLEVSINGGALQQIPGGGSYTPPVTTKGDVFTYSTTPTRLGVGTNGQCLQADSTQTTGLKWGTCGSGTANPAQSHTVTFSATPTFTCGSASAGTVDYFYMSTALTANITSSTLASCTTGQSLVFSFVQDGTGGRTVAMPTGFSQACQVNPQASSTTNMAFTWDGSNAQLISCQSTGAAISPPVAFSTLPACSSATAGATASISDSTTTVQGATILGSSSNNVQGYCNGTNWIVVSGASAPPSGNAGGALGGTYPNPSLATKYQTFSCTGGWGDGLNAIPAGTYVQFSCVNTTGATWTLTGISCYTDNAGTTTLNAANNAATGLLTGAVTCNNTKSGGGAAGTQSATTTLANNDAITFTGVADGTSKQITYTVTLTK